MPAVTYCGRGLSDKVSLVLLSKVEEKVESYWRMPHGIYNSDSEPPTRAVTINIRITRALVGYLHIDVARQLRVVRLDGANLLECTEDDRLRRPNVEHPAENI